MTQRMPATWLTRNLIYTRQGTIWAVWRLSAMAYGLRPDRAKRGVHAAHVGLLRAIQGEYMLMGTCATVDPAGVVERMIHDIDLSEHALWAREAEATLDLLEAIELGQRTFWLAAPLRSTSPLDYVKAFSESVLTDVGDSLGLPLKRPSDQEVAQRLKQTERITAAIPGSFSARPATAAEVAWLFMHAQQRGVPHEAALPVNLDGKPERTLMRTGAALPDPILDPGGQEDLSSRMRFNPLKRRFVKITDPASDLSTYQTSLAVLDAPPGGLVFPGTEWIGRLDESGVEADWTIRVRSRARAKVVQENKRALKELTDQYEQQGASGGMTSSLDHTAELLSSYDSLMSNDDLEVELSFTTILTVGASTGEQALEKARAVRSHLGSSGWGFKVVIEPGAQESLWWATLPGVATTPTITRLAQLAPSRDLATSVPITTTGLGDPAGLLLALGISSAVLSPVLLDFESATSKLDGAIAMAVCGELGAGKSVTLKKISTGLVARGAQLIALDRSEVGEWAQAFEGYAGRVVVDVNEHAAWSTDPLRVLPGADGAGAAQSFLQTLLHVSASSPQGVLLSTVLSEEYRSRHELTCLGDVMTHLAGGNCDRPGAQEVGDKMHAFAQHPWAKTIFDKDLPPVPVEAPVVVMRTHRLELPTPDELNVAHRFETLSLAKLFGRAVHTLITSLGRWICFRDSSRLAGLVVDEAASVTGSPESQNELEIWLRDGRKHKSYLLMGSHDAEQDFGSEVLRKLIPARMVMRHRDEGLARRALRWIGLDETDQDLVDLVTGGLSPLPGDGELPDPARRGEGLLRDFRNRMGLVKVLPPADPQAAAGVFTTPEGAEAPR